MTNVNNNKNKKTNVPNLRFPGFNEEWKKYCCSDFLDFYPTNSLSWDKLNFEEKNIKNIHYGMIHNGLLTMTDVATSKIPYVNKDIVLKTYTLCENGDIVFVDASENTDDIGKSIEIISTNNESVVCGLHTIHARDTMKITDLGFKGYLFSAAPFRKKIKKLTQGSKVYSISRKNFDEIELAIPEKQEQQKITQFLCLIDKRIEAQNKIIEKIESLIKGIRKRIFSNIKQYDNTAKLEKLGFFLEAYSKFNTSNDLQPVAVGKYGIRLRNNIYSKDLSDDYSKNKVILQDTLVIGMGSSQIDIGILHEDLKYCVSPAYSTYKIKNIDSFFLNEYLLMLNKKLSNKYMIIGARQGKSVNKKDMLLHKIHIPRIEIQQKIAEKIKLLYQKLETEKTILQVFNQQKLFLLKNMFI